MTTETQSPRAGDGNLPAPCNCPNIGYCDGSCAPYNGQPSDELPKVVQTAPAKIYLVIGDDCPQDISFRELCSRFDDGVTWCEDKIDANSIGYVRADLAAAPAVSAPAGWVSFADREPPRDARLDNPTVIAGRKVLVTNNFKARDAMGRMSHVWFVSPIKTDDGWVAFDEADRKIFDLTYWFDPLAEIAPPVTGDQP